MGIVLQCLLVAGPALTGPTSPLTRRPAAADAAAAASQPVTMVQFNTPVEITIRTKQRNVLRGLMLSFDAKAVQFQTRQGKVIAYPTARIRTLRSRDGRFSWQPGSETFETARKKAELFQSQIPMVGIAGSGVPRPGTALVPGPRRVGPLIPKPISRPPTGSPTAPSSTVPAIPGPTSSPRIPGAIGPSQPPTAAPQMPAGTVVSPRSPRSQPVPEEQVRVCPHCQRAVPASLSAGNFCPYCGVRWSEGRHMPAADGAAAHDVEIPVRLPPGNPEAGPMSWHQLGRKYWWAGLVLLVGWAVWLLRS